MNACFLSSVCSLRSTTNQKRIEVFEYADLIELSVMLKGIDRLYSAELTNVVIVLDARYCGNLVSLADRKNRGYRLVIATSGERLAGIEDVCDLEGTSWEQIVIERGVEECLRREMNELNFGDRLVILRPNWVRYTA